MKIRIRRLASIIAIALFAASSSQAHADLTSSMDAMWNSTAPSSTHVPGRSGYDMGSFSMRIPVRNYTLVHIDMPRINAGCGGIDIHGGSFSIITAEQFKQMIRQIAQNAAGYLMYLALEMMCPSCKTLLRDLQAMMTELNNLRINTCSTNMKSTMDRFFSKGSSVMETAGKAVGQFATAIGVNTDSSSEDATANRSGGFNTGAAGTTQAEADQVAKAVGQVGNITYRLIKRSDKLRNLTTDLGLGEQDMVQMMVAIAGTTIVPVDDGTASTTVMAKVVSPGQIAPRVLSLDMLRLGTGGTAAMAAAEGKLADTYECEAYTSPSGSPTFAAYSSEETSCMQMRVTQLNFRGVRSYVTGKIFGDSEAAQQMATYDPGSIVHNIVNGVSLTSAQSRFLAAVRIPVARMLIEANYGLSDASIRAIASQVVDPIAYDMTATLGRALISTLRSSVHGRGTANTDDAGLAPLTVPEEVLRNLDAAEKELHSMSDNAQQGAKGLVAILDSVKAMRGLYATNGRGTWTQQVVRGQRK